MNFDDWFDINFGFRIHISPSVDFLVPYGRQQQQKWYIVIEMDVSAWEKIHNAILELFSDNSILFGYWKNGNIEQVQNEHRLSIVKVENWFHFLFYSLPVKRNDKEFLFMRVNKNVSFMKQYLVTYCSQRFSLFWWIHQQTIFNLDGKTDQRCAHFGRINQSWVKMCLQPTKHLFRT